MTQKVESRVTTRVFITPAQMQSTLAEQVRHDSKTLGQLTYVQDLTNLFSDVSVEQIIHQVFELVRFEQYKDIRVMFSPCGATCIYSDKFILPEQAAAMISKSAEQPGEDN